MESEFKTTIIKTTESILGQLVQDLSSQHQQHENTYTFLDSFIDQLESAVDSGAVKPATKKLPVLKHQRSRSDHLAEFHRKKDSRSTQLQRFLPLKGGINPGFTEIKSTNFVTDPSSVFFNQLYAAHVKYGKIALKLLGRKAAMPATQSVPVSPQKIRGKIVMLGDQANDTTLGVSAQKELARKGLPSVYKRTKSITSSDKSESKDKTQDAKVNYTQMEELPQITQVRESSGAKYWSAGNLKVLPNRSRSF